MKKIIDGKTYNTETAIRLSGNGTSGLSMSDFRYFKEGLYRTNKGTYFIAGEGHALTKYAKSSGNCSGWGEKLYLITESDARRFIEDHGTHEEYIKAFGEPEEG